MTGSIIGFVGHSRGEAAQGDIVLDVRALRARTSNTISPASAAGASMRWWRQLDSLLVKRERYAETLLLAGRRCPGYYHRHRRPYVYIEFCQHSQPAAPGCAACAHSRSYRRRPPHPIASMKI